MGELDRSHKFDQYARIQAENELEMCRLDDEAASRRRLHGDVRRKSQRDADSAYFEAHYHSLVQGRPVAAPQPRPAPDQESLQRAGCFRYYMFE